MNLTMVEIPVQQVDVLDQDIKVAIDLPDGRQVMLLVDSEALETYISTLVDKGMESVQANKSDMKAMMMKASLNASMLAVGPMLVDLLWHKEGKKPKPGRGDDSIEWYTRFCIEQLVEIARNAEGLIHLLSNKVGQIDEQKAAIRICGIATEPIPNAGTTA